MAQKVIKIQSGKDVEKALVRDGGSYRRGKGTTHGVGYCPDGSTIGYHRHGEYRPGIRATIVKQLLEGGVTNIKVIAAGLFVGVLIGVIGQCLL